MYLKALEIQGFKSFPDKVVLTFEHDITAIVGPNGSGKSNTSDAVRWVMGEQSTKALRGGKMEDVIFGGTAKRKQLGFAEVSLVLDNTTQLLPTMDESEVVVTRRYYRSGESEYFINRHSVRLKDVNELFMDTGLGREGYSIIGQGKIDEILSVKSADRREVFEEAAGISRYRHRKEEAERKLARTEDNLLRINDKISELELQVEPLRVQSEKAKKYLILRDELRGLEISLWMEQLEKIRENGVKAIDDFEHALRQKTEIQDIVEKLYAAAEDYATKMREKDIEAEGIRFEMMKRGADANECERAVAVLEAQIQSHLDQAERVKRELDQQEGRAGSITAQIDERHMRLDEIVANLTKLQETLVETSHAAAEESRNAGTLQSQLESLRQKQAMETASASEAKALLSALAAASQELQERHSAVEHEIAESKQKVSDTHVEGDGVKAELDQAIEDKESLMNMINGYTLRVESREKKAKTVEESHVKLQMEENALNSRIQMLAEMEKMYEGYSKSVKLVMSEAERGQLKNVHGPIAGLIQVPDEYAVAVEIALGGAMQNVVVGSESDGKNAIQFLKRRDAGRATFLPLNTIRPSEFKDEKVEKETGFVGMADKLIQFDGQYKDVFSSLLGRIVVAEDMDKALAMAKKFNYRFRVVTLDGQVLNPGGSMTGGSVSRSAGILSRANELERLHHDVDELKEKMSESARSLEEVRREVTAANYEMEAAQSNRRELEDTILKMEERWGHYEQIYADLAQKQEELSNELTLIETRTKQNEQDSVNTRKRIQELEGSAEALRAEAEGKSQGQEEIKNRMDAVQNKLTALNVEIAALEAEKSASQTALDELVALKRDITGDRSERETMLAELEGKNSQLEDDVKNKKQLLEDIQAENQVRSTTIKRLQEEKLAMEADRNRADKESRDKNSELLAMEREVSVLEQKKVTAALEEKQILDRLWESYELSHEAAKGQRIEIESTGGAQKRVAELKRSISSLGNINLDAVEEFLRINERYTYFTDQRDDITKSKRELETIIAGITNEMKTIFEEQFKTINTAFGETFVELFGGGKATLELENPDDILNCGIEIKVQPPGKALKIITLLSGGEKAFVAIALYFAILKVRPTPFCVMDEIEAALDDANVHRYARYLRMMADKTQFIVITHRRGTMEEADVLYGVTMQEQGVSKLLSLNLNDVEKELNL